MGRGKHTRRIHFHMVSEGIPEEGIRSAWTYGKIVETDALRKINKRRIDGQLVNCGQDYSALAAYMFAHWSSEQGGHRYFFTRNRKEPIVEAPKECRRRYTAEKPPRAPKGWRIIEVKTTDYGYACYKYVYDPQGIELIT